MSISTAPAQRFLACISDPSRFRMVMSLARGERCVTELAAEVGLSQSCTTRHLQALQREGIVRGVRAGKRVMFALRPAREHPVLRWALSEERANGEPLPASPDSPAPNTAPVHHEAGWISDSPANPVAPPVPTAAGQDPPHRELEDFLL